MSEYYNPDLTLPQKVGLQARQNTLVQTYMSDEERANFNEFRANMPEMERVKPKERIPAELPRDQFIEALPKLIMQAIEHDNRPMVRVSWVGNGPGTMGGRPCSSFVMISSRTREHWAGVYAKQLTAAIERVEKDAGGKFYSLTFLKG